MSTIYGDERTVLITGGTGFIGSYLANNLIEKHMRVILVDSNPDTRRIDGFGINSDQYIFAQCDITERDVLLDIFDLYRPHSVYHLGALLSAGAEANPTLGIRVDIIGTWNILEAARLHLETGRKPEPLKVLFPSTIASFGDHLPADQQPPDSKVANASVQMPTTFYGASKVTSERLGEQYHRKQWVDFRAVRFPSVIGAARGPGGTTVYSTLMVQQPALGNPYSVYVPGDTRLDVMYVKDAVRALTGLHDADAAKLTTRVYNVSGIRNANDQAPQASEIAAAVRDALGANTPAISFDNPDDTLTKIVTSFGILNDQQAQQDWGWQPEYKDLAKAVTDFIDQVKKYPNRIKRLELY